MTEAWLEWANSKTLTVVLGRWMTSMMLSFNY
jgi:hypothetical protein